MGLIWDLYGGFHQWGYAKLDGSFAGKSQSNIDDLEVPLFQETSIWD